MIGKVNHAKCRECGGDVLPFYSCDPGDGVKCDCHGCLADGQISCVDCWEIFDLEGNKE